MIIRMFFWWYTLGWKHAFRSILQRPNSVLEQFSVPILLKTLFEPWKQIKSYAGVSSSIDAKMQVLFDNAFARTFGFVLRINLIFIAAFIASFIMISSIILAVIWPLVPLLPIVFIFLGVQ